MTEQESEDALTREGLFAKLQDLQKPITLQELASILNTSVRHDETNKIISFLTMLLTYTDADQLNLSYTAESSTGKSYIPLELAWYFPSQDVIEYCYVSPTAFYHEYGSLVVDPNDTRDIEDEKKHKIIYINLHQKILIFLDQPHDILLQRLRPLLSHDRKVLLSKITNRNTNRTESIKIEGYPSVLFCTAKFSMEDQERTRLLLLSPDVSQEKLKDSILLKLERESDRDAFSKYMESDPKRRWLANRVEAVKEAHIKNVIIPEDLREKIARQFFESHKHLIPRHQRDFGRLMGLIRACAILNLWQKQRIEENLIADESDIENGFKLYTCISMANELGLPPEVFRIFMAIKDKIPVIGVTRTDVLKLYYDAFHRTIGKKRLEEVLNLLLSVGLFNEEQDKQDGRVKRYVVTGQGVYISEAETTLENYGKLEPKLNTPRPVSSGEPFKNIKLDDVLKLEPLSGAFQDKCLECGFQGQMGWQVTQHNGDWALLCRPCGDRLDQQIGEHTP